MRLPTQKLQNQLFRVLRALHYIAGEIIPVINSFSSPSIPLDVTELQEISSGRGISHLLGGPWFTEGLPTDDMT